MDYNIVFSLESSSDFSKEDCIVFQTIRNKELPKLVGITTLNQAKEFLRHSEKPSIYVTARDKNIEPPSLIGVLISRYRVEPYEGNWFFMVVKREYQRKGIGRSLLDLLKTQVDELSAWVVPHDEYQKNNGSKYLSPLEFYRKNDFFVRERKWKTNKGLECIDIIWKKEKNK